MQIILSILVFFLIFSALVLVHEWGHFMAARKAKVRVDEFGFGLPPRAKVIAKKNGVTYSINWIPFGGFVRMYGEEEVTTKKDKGAFNSKTVWQRISIVLAGVFMNFLLAFVLLTVCLTAGMETIILPNELPTALQDGRVTVLPQIGGVLTDSPALEAGLQAGDKITALDGTAITSSEEIQAILKEKINTAVLFTVSRGEESLTLPVVTDEAGKIGISFALQLKIDQYPFYTAPYYALQETGRLSLETVKFAGSFFGKILTQGELEDGVGGPVKIAEMTYTLVSFGDLIKILQFVVLLSLSLAVVNLMPLPALDGGRFFFLLIELVTGRPVNQNFEILLHRLGFFALMLLIIIITYRDILYLF